MSLEERTLKFIKELRDHHGYDDVPIVDELIEAWELNLSTLSLIDRWYNAVGSDIDGLAKILDKEIKLNWGPREVKEE